MRCVCRRAVEIEQTKIMKVEIQQQDKEEFESLACKDNIVIVNAESLLRPTVVPLRKEPLC